MKKKLIASLAAAAALGTSFLANAAIEKNQLTVWVNDDKGYNGIAKVGERYTKKTGVKVPSCPARAPVPAGSRHRERP